MGWLTSARAPAEGKQNNEGLLRFFGGSLPDPQYPGSTFLEHYGDGYDKNELVYACIDEKATSATEAPLRVYRRDGLGEPIEDHPLRLLLANPNPVLTEFELFELLVTHLDLAGTGFWWIARDRGGRPVELWPLRPDLVRMRVALHRGVATTVQGYSYVVDGSVGEADAIRQEVDLGTDVVHFKLPNPVDPLVGQPPLRPAMRATALDNEATDFVKSLLQNHAMPGVAIESESELNETVTERLKEDWKLKFGKHRRGEPAFLQKGMKVHTLGITPQQLEFPDLRTISESRICMAFGVPPIVLGAKVGLDRSTFANYKEARASLWEETLMPMQRRIRDTIAAKLLPEVTTGVRPRRVQVRFDHSQVLALKESEQARWERATQALRAGGIMVSDFRDQVGLEPVEGADVFLRPAGVIPTSADGTPTGGGELQATPARRSLLAGTEGKQTPARDDFERELTTTLAAFFQDQRDAAQGALYRASSDRRVAVKQLLNLAEWNERLTQTLGPLMLRTATESGRTTADRLGVSYSVRQTLAWMREAAVNIAAAINTQTLEGVEQAVSEADDDIEAVATLFTTYATSRAALLAGDLVTEMLAWGTREAGHQAQQQTGGDATKTWLVTSDDPRSTHQALHGETVGIDDKFSNGGRWPGDSTLPAAERAGCRCELDVSVRSS